MKELKITIPGSVVSKKNSKRVVLVGGKNVPRRPMVLPSKAYEEWEKHAYSGTDIVGFQETNKETKLYRFAFGEVKTSEQEKWPPGVMNGRHGLMKQLEDLRDSTNVKDSLVKYLGHHADRAAWLPLYKSAAKRYLSDPCDVSLFGILIRDVEPKPEDLARRAKDLAAGCPDTTSIELRAMYLPRKTINSLSERAVRARGGDYVKN